MLRLRQPPSAWGIPSVSPFCMKLETWLKIAEIPYENAMPDFEIAPKGKIPYIEDGDVTMGDSTLIIEHLIATRGKDPDAGLSRQERAISLAFRRMIKENLFWAMIQSRFREEQGWSLYKEVLAGLQVAAPPEVRAVIVDMVHQSLIAQMQGHGMGRHSAEEIYRMGKADLTAVSDFLGDKPFFMGDRPTTADATVYAQVANIIDVPLDSPLREHGRSLRNLVDYCERMRARFFPDLPRH